MVDELCKLGVKKEVRDKGRTVLMAYSEQKLQNLALQLLLSGYDVNKSAETRPKEAVKRKPEKYDTDISYAVLSKDLFLLDLLLAFGIDLNADNQSIDLKNLVLIDWRREKKDMLQLIYWLLDKFGVPDKEEDNKQADQPKRPNLHVPRYSKNLKQFLAEKENASESLKRRFCRILLYEQQFVSFKEVLAPSEEGRLAILNDIYNMAEAEEERLGPIPKIKSFRLLSYSLICFADSLNIILVED